MIARADRPTVRLAAKKETAPMIASSRARHLLALTSAALLLLLSAFASSAPAAGFEVTAFDGLLADSSGEAFTAAAGHPASSLTNFNFTSFSDSTQEGLLGAVEDPRDTSVSLPAGLLGNPAGLEQCTAFQLAQGESALVPKPKCPEGSQLGRLSLHTIGTDEPPFFSKAPLFNMVPPPGVPARFGASVAGTSVAIDAKVSREGADLRISLGSVDIPQGVSFYGNTIEFWGVPAGPAHDTERACSGQGKPSEGGPTCPAPGEPPVAAPRAFLRTPTSCTTQGLRYDLSADSWQGPGDFSTASYLTHEVPGYPEAPEAWGSPVGIEGCEEVPFQPTLSVDTTTPFADSPTGLSLDIGLPTDCWDAKATEEEAEEAICQSDTRKAEVTLPQGLAINPSAAGGRAACSPAQAGVTSSIGQSPVTFDEAPFSCPNSSKIGDVEIATPLLNDPLKGALYLAQQGQNPFGSLLATYLLAEGSGVVIKQAGQISLDANGRVSTSFADTPQAPFSNVHVALYGGPRAALRTPPTCGTYTTRGTLTPWSGNAPVSLSSSFAVTQGCGGGFDPKLDAGTENPLAGSTAPFNLRVSRADGSQELGSIRANLPKGLTGYLTGIEHCSDAALAAVSSLPGTGASQEATPSCPASSQVGVVTVGAGAGVNPFYTPQGKAYLAGPYKGAALSLAVITPAVAGPFDLGSVVVRNAIYVNPETAELSVQSDPLPAILQGIPLDLRDVRVSVDRNHFTLNPTSCEPLQVGSTLTSTEGAVASPAVHFQVAGCDRLAFKPKLSFTLRGKTNRGSHPALRAVLTMPRKTGANLAGAAVALPHSEFLDQSHIGTVCTRVQFAADACPKASIYGYARATSPIVDYAVQGPVYLRSSSHELPDLVLALRGPYTQPIEVDAVGRIDSVGGGIRTSFEAVPDVPLTKVTLSMRGGARGLLQNSTNICAGEHRASASFVGQNGKLSQQSPSLAAKCAKAKKHAAKPNHSR